MNVMYVGEGDGLTSLKTAWRAVYEQEIEDEQIKKFLEQPQGIVHYIGRNSAQNPIYWVAVGSSKTICKQAWIELWSLLGETIQNWKLIE